MAIYSFARGIFPDASKVVASIMNDDMCRQRVCCRCHALYEERENIGAWRCSAHPRPYDPSREVYLCCQTTSNGCVRCDHTEDTQNAYPGCVREFAITGGVPAFAVLPANLGELVGVQAASVLTSCIVGDKNLYILRRSSNATTLLLKPSAS